MKKILFISVIPGNMQSLINYYNNNSNKRYSIEIMDCYKFYDNKILGQLYKTSYLLKRYDLVISDYPTELIRLGKKKIYMDHGSGLKLMPGKHEVNDKKVIKVSKCISEVDEFIIQSPREEEILYSWLPYIDRKKMKFKCLGQPRNDKLFSDNYKRIAKKEIYSKFKIDLKDKLLLLAPTWRGYTCDFSNFFNSDDLTRLNSFLKNRNITLMYRPHYLEDIVGKESLSKLEKCIVVDNKMENDAQKILASTDFLITDFSGILTEYLAINKPIMFLDLDTELYKNFRGLAIDYYNDIHTPGPKVKDINSVIEYIENIINNKDSYKLYRDKAIEYYYGYYDGNSCERVWNLINDILK